MNSIKKLAKILAFSAVTCMATSPAGAVTWHTGDGSIDGSLCVGHDCPSNPSFGFDTLRLQENNLRLHFQDTSNSASFPANDWRLVANDSQNGGANHFSIQDATAVRNIFRLFAGARVNALTVDSGGDIGIGTANGVLDLHIVSGNTPAIRLDQNGTSGFTPQVWDINGNEANFFIRDATNGSRLPFRIRPGAATSAIDIDSSGNVRMGHASIAEAQLHVREPSAAVAARTLLKLENAGNTKFEIENTDADNTWAFANQGMDFRISLQDSGVVEFRIDNSGDAFLEGTLTENSDVNSKQEIVAVDPDSILARVIGLPISQWQYKDAPGVNHLGPMAQDFHAAFGLGASNTGISTLDTSGVALAAIQALAEQNATLEQDNQQLRAHNLSLEQRLHRVEQQQGRIAALEAVVMELARDRAVAVQASLVPN